MRFKGIIIVLLTVAVLAVVCASVQPGYEGKAKIVLQLVQMPATPTPMPQVDFAQTGSFAEEASPMTFGFAQAPEAPQGTVLQADVLYSSDPAIKTGDTYMLLVEYNDNNVPSGMQSGLLDKLLPGAILGINDYTLNGNQIDVDVGGSAFWDQKIFVLDMSGTKPGESYNPFKIDLNIFKDFSSLYPYSNTNVTPTPTPGPTTWPSPSIWPTPSTFPVLDTTGIVNNIFANFVELGAMRIK